MVIFCIEGGVRINSLHAVIELIVNYKGANGELSRETFKDPQDEAEARIKEVDAQIFELETKAKIDYRLIDEVLSLTTNIHQTYEEAPDFLKRHYLRLFLERIYVKDKKVWKIVENPVFSVLRKQHQVLIRGELLALVDYVGTFYANPNSFPVLQDNF